MSFIPTDYFAAREQFKKLASSLEFQPDSFQIESASSSTSGLTVDSVFLGDKNATNVIAIISGVHGIEGYAGSACIQYFLRHYRSHFARNDIAYLIVHILNPWGFANDSRVTEENIDLNRNFVNFAMPLPFSIGYARFHAMLCEDYRPGLSGFFNEVQLLRSVLGSKNRRAFQQAATGGQYQYKDGLFYGGTQVTQNQKILSQIMQTHLQLGQNVRCLDIHSGLGKKGQGALLTHHPPTAFKFKMLHNWLDGQVTSTSDNTNISAVVRGHLPGHVEAFFGKTCFAITFEFGVSGPLFTLNALRADNWLRTTQSKTAAVVSKAAINKRCGKHSCARVQVGSTR